MLSAVSILCWRWETHQKTGVLDNERKYNTVDPDGTDVGPTLQYRSRVRISVIWRESLSVRLPY